MTSAIAIAPSPGRSNGDAAQQDQPPVAPHRLPHRRVHRRFSVLSFFLVSMSQGSNAYTRFQSFFMSTTVQPLRSASSSALSSLPMRDLRS